MKGKVAIITVSDRSYQGQREDLAGPLLAEIMESEGYEVVEKSIVPDEKEMIKEELIRLSDNMEIGLILTSGGTGFSPRDITPEATMEVVDRETPGLSEYMRSFSAQYTDRSYLSRARSGIRKLSLIINLPGSPKALKENLEGILPILSHGLDMLRKGQADCANEMIDQ